MHDSIPVLDHGFVRLVDFMGDDLSIVRSARVSYDAAWRAGQDEGSDHRLINYLWKNGHTTPFESVTMTFEVKAPIFVVRQWHRHRTQSYNELSARYRELPEEVYIPDPATIGIQSKDNKQMRDMVENEHAKKFAYLIRGNAAASFATYRALLAEGCPREIARSVLPVGTYTHMFTTMNLLNCFSFLTERTHEHAQWEIQQYANAMLEFVDEIAPNAVAAWKESRA